MNSRPPGRSRPATTRAQRAMSGSQHSAPIPVYTRSNGSGPSAPAASYTSASTKRMSAPARLAIRRACASEAAEKSSPVMAAPRRASETVSVPMWHCR